MPQIHPLLLIAASFFISSVTFSAEPADAPWGGATLTETEYKPQKVVYDVHVTTVKAFESVLDREHHHRC